MRQYNPTIRYTNGGGTYYDPSTNTMTTDTTNGDPGVQLVHEAGYVQAGFNGGPGALGPGAYTRNDYVNSLYVNSLLNEETDATVAQIQANQALQASNPSAPSTAMQANS